MISPGAKAALRQVIRWSRSGGLRHLRPFVLLCVGVAGSGAALSGSLCFDGAVPVPESLVSRWPLPRGEAVRDALLAAYGDPGRGYHDLTHLTEVLDRLDELGTAGVAFAPLPVVLAAWFHDGVYDGRPGVEERSAEWAETALPALAGRDVAAEVARLVRLTEGHRPTAGDADGEALCDADLAILAAGEARYGAYTAAVRREYAHVADDDFARGRAAILRELLGKPTLFHTAYARDRWEAAARANVEAELTRLRPCC